MVIREILFGRARGLYGVLVGDLNELGGKERFEVRVWKGEEDEEEWIEIWENMV